MLPDELLASIDATLKDIAAMLRAVAPKPAASDADLDGQYGDPVVKMKDPRDWSGESMQGRHYSECPADYLDMVASRADYFAQKNDETGATASNGKPKAHYDRIDAARARGWAKRIRNGWKPQAAPAWATGADDERDPF